MWSRQLTQSNRLHLINSWFSCDVYYLLLIITLWILVCYLNDTFNDRNNSICHIHPPIASFKLLAYNYTCRFQLNWLCNKAYLRSWLTDAFLSWKKPYSFYFYTMEFHFYLTFCIQWPQDIVSLYWRTFVLHFMSSECIQILKYIERLTLRY